jgi:hypothetical protein
MTNFSDHFKGGGELSDAYTQIGALYKALSQLIDAVEKCDGDIDSISNVLAQAKITLQAANDGEGEL